MQLHYGGDDETVFNELEFCSANGDVYTIRIPEGGNTGCAKLPVLFCVALQDAMRAVRLRHPDVVIIGFMDDNHILGPADRVLAAYADMRHVLKEELNLDFNDSKTAVFPEKNVSLACRRSMEELELYDETTRELCITEGVELAGAPLGSPDFVTLVLQKRLDKLTALAEKLEALAKRGDATWQGLLQLVQQCVATINPHLARSILPDTMRSFAISVDGIVARMCLVVSGLCGAADESGEQFSDVELRKRRILLCSKLGGLGTLCLTRTLEPAFVGAAALVGPVIKELAPSLINLDAVCPTLDALRAAIEVCKAALPTAAECDETQDEGEGGSNRGLDDSGAEQAGAGGGGGSQREPRAARRALARKEEA